MDEQPPPLDAEQPPPLDAGTSAPPPATPPRQPGASPLAYASPSAVSAGVASSPASTRWRLGGKLQTGHLPNYASSSTVRAAESAAGAAARDLRNSTANSQDITARLRALRSDQGSVSTLLGSSDRSPAPGVSAASPSRSLGSPRRLAAAGALGSPGAPPLALPIPSAARQR